MFEPGPLAFLTLLLSLPLAVGIFMNMRPPLAAATVFVGAVMFLPEAVAIDPPLLPPFGKDQMAAVGIMIGCVLKGRGRLQSARFLRGPELLVVLLMLAAFGTASTNGETLYYGPTVLPALRLYDGISIAVRDLLGFGVPFFLGRALYQTTDDAHDLLRVLVLGGLLYTPFMLFEVRMSPQLHNIVFGYSQTVDFLQTMRWGGYRPVVFMSHGLAVGLFIVETLLAAVTLLKAKLRIRYVSTRTATFILAFMLFMAKSTGAILYGLLGLPILWLLKPAGQLRIVTVVALLVLLYPLSRALDFFPVEGTVGLANSLSAERGQSLEFRLQNEEILVARAAEKPIFGWGGFGRGRVFDAEMGKDISVTDGFWIIQLGNQGIVGLLVPFLLLTLPMLQAARRRRLIAPQGQRLLGGLALLIAFASVDLLPNGLYSNIPFFLAGALYGLAMALPREQDDEATDSGYDDDDGAPGEDPGRDPDQWTATVSGASR